MPEIHWIMMVCNDHLVGGLVAIWIIFPYIGLLIIPIDFPIFQRGGPTTNQLGINIHSPAMTLGTVWVPGFRPMTIAMYWRFLTEFSMEVTAHGWPLTLAQVPPGWYVATSGAMCKGSIPTVDGAEILHLLWWLKHQESYGIHHRSTPGYEVIQHQ